LAQVPSTATAATATITPPAGGPEPPEGTTIIMLEGPWTSPANRGRGFTVPSSATANSIYLIRVTADTPQGPVQSDLITLTISGGAAIPCLPVSAWFQGHGTTERNITAAAGATITVLARPFGTVTVVRANIQGTPAPPQGSTITLATGSWPSPATRGGSFTIPATATSGTVYAVRVVATFSTGCDGNAPPITVTVQ
jgi:hypothetical protein